MEHVLKVRKKYGIIMDMMMKKHVSKMKVVWWMHVDKKNENYIEDTTQSWNNGLLYYHKLYL